MKKRFRADWNTPVRCLSEEDMKVPRVGEKLVQALGQREVRVIDALWQYEAATIEAKW